MLEELLKFDKIGSKNELLFFLFDALNISKAQKIEHLKKYCLSNDFSICKSFNGILKLLQFISYIDIIGENVIVNNCLFNSKEVNEPQNYFLNSSFFENILIALKKENSLTHFFNSEVLKYNNELRRYYVKDNLIPHKYLPIRNLLISINCFERDHIINNHLLLPENYNNVIKNIIIDNLLKEQQDKDKRKISLETLKRNLEKKSLRGEEAEKFVLILEQTRLENHENSSSIKRISDEYVNAGYDIESFLNRESIVIDKYIEVKSFSGKISFYWSKNEVEIARTLKNNYFIYLVDINRITQTDYKPIVLENPYEKVFENEFWKKEIENWSIKLDSSIK